MIDLLATLPTQFSESIIPPVTDTTSYIIEDSTTGATWTTQQIMKYQRYAGAMRSIRTFKVLKVLKYYTILLEGTVNVFKIPPI